MERHHNAQIIGAAGQARDGASLGRIAGHSLRFVVVSLQMHRDEQERIGVVSTLPGQGKLSRRVGNGNDAGRSGKRSLGYCR